MRISRANLEYYYFFLIIFNIIHQHLYHYQYFRGESQPCMNSLILNSILEEMYCCGGRWTIDDLDGDHLVFLSLVSRNLAKVSIHWPSRWRFRLRIVKFFDEDCWSWCKMVFSLSWRTYEFFLLIFFSYWSNIKNWFFSWFWDDWVLLSEYLRFPDDFWVCWQQIIIFLIIFPRIKEIYYFSYRVLGFQIFLWLVFIFWQLLIFILDHFQWIISRDWIIVWNNWDIYFEIHRKVDRYFHLIFSSRRHNLILCCLVFIHMMILFPLLFILIGLRLCFAFRFEGALFLVLGVRVIIGRARMKIIFLIFILLILVLGSFGTECGRYQLMRGVS